MRRTVIFLFLIFNSLSIFSQDVNQVVLDSRGNKMLLGPTTKTALQAAPFKDWFDTNYNDYLENSKVIKRLKDSLDQYTIKAFYGTWCGDSKRHMPEFYKILDATNFPENQLEVIALDNKDDAYKQAPNGEEKGLNIHRVPTFILYKEGKEVNRIVEEPVSTLEKDLLNIVSGKRYKSKYLAATYLGNLVNEKPLDSLHGEVEQLRDVLSNHVKHSGELNTLGYVLLRAKEIDKALLVFEVNKAIFPYNLNIIDSYAEALYEKKSYSEALKNYYKILSIYPEDENAKKMIAEIELLNK